METSSQPLDIRDLNLHFKSGYLDSRKIERAPRSPNPVKAYCVDHIMYWAYPGSRKSKELDIKATNVSTYIVSRDYLEDKDNWK